MTGEAFTGFAENLMAKLGEKEKNEIIKVLNL
jgi:hypothetical protein